MKNNRRNTYVWGCGKYLQNRMNEELAEELSIVGFVDNKLRGGLYGRDIISPNDLRDVDRIIVASILYFDEIKNEIKQLGLDVEIVFIDDALAEELARVAFRFISDEILAGDNHKIINEHKTEVIAYGVIPWKVSIHKDKLERYFEIIKGDLEDVWNLGEKKILAYSVGDAINLCKNYGLNNIICAELFLFQNEKINIDNLNITATRTAGTSVSDSKIYPLFCLAATRDENIFRDFRRSFIYLDTVGAASKEFGEKALAYILGRIPLFSEKDLYEFLKNDEIGNPYTYYFKINDKNIQADPNTFAYIMQLQELRIELGQLFNHGDIHSVCEIGVGYGGLCRLICQYFDIAEYTLVDLPEVVGLAKKYLSRFELSNRIVGVPGTQDVNDIHPDLVISNYAFCELGREAQEKYMHKVILNAAHGMMIWNRCSEFDSNLNGMTMEEFIGAVTNAKVWENPLIGEATRFISWSK